MKKVLVAMSGGIDSSVTAALLQDQGYEVGGITMRLLQTYEKNDPAMDGALVAEKLGIKHHIINLADFFESTVISYFVNDYLHGNTPNPCIRCNKMLKFGLLLDKAVELGYEYFATGHYARIIDQYLVRGIDNIKDQSYFLYPIYTRDIERILFPLGGMTKQEVRNIAEKIGLHNAKKKESQDICFIQNGDYAEFLTKKCGNEFYPGPIVDVSGKIIGSHCGIHKFTIGQRKGLGALGKPMFVKEILPLSNTVIVADDNELLTDSIIIKDTVFCPKTADPEKTYSIQVRYRSKAVACRINFIDESTLKVIFTEPVRAIAPGQSAVIYDADRVVGGGIIER